VKSEPTLLVKASVTASTTAPPSLSEKTQSVQHPSDGMTAAEVLLERAGVYQGDEVTLQIDDGIAIVTLQDRANRNMFTQRFIHGLAARLVQAQQTPGVKTIILTGYDNVFCMGGSREELMTLVERKADVDDFPFLFRGLLECKIPVIAAIQGHAVGGGLVFGLYADVVVMSEDGVYSANFMKYGFTPGMGATMILREKLGPNLATEMMFTAKSLAGAELHARGASLVFRKSGDVLSEAVSIARTLCEKPLYALEVLKKELSGRVLEGLPDIIKRETRMHAHTFTQPEVRKRVQAYFAKTQAGRAEAAKAAQGNSALTDTSITAPSTSGKIILRKQAAAMQPAKSEPDARLALPLRLSVPPATQKVTTTKAATTVVVRSDKAVTDTVESVLCQVLQAEPGSIDSQRSFNDLGVDSVTGVEIVRDLNKALGINLEAVAIYDYSSIETLARYVCEVCGVCGVCEGMAEIPGQQATADMVPELIPGNDDATSLSDGAFPRGTHEPGTSVLTLASGSNQAGDSWEAVSVNIESIVRKALQADQETIDAESSFLDLGIDSIIGVEIVRDVNKEFGLMLDAVAIYDYSTIAALSRYVYECCNKMIPERDVAVAPDKGVKIALTPRVSVSQATESGVFVVADAVKNGEAKQVVSIAAPALLPEPDTLAVATDVEAIFRRVLHAQDETLDPERNFIELGVDSVTGVEMMRGISQAFDLNLEAVVIYDYPTLAALTAYVVRLLAERGNAHAQASLQLKALVHQESSKGDFENEGLENEGLEDEGLIELLRQLQDGEIAVEDAEDLIGV
ncbi:MAG: enoyl-CoA hydratase/isomerase family protein, partial [Ectothiorhodospiraceae bacterium]|nr:enoyl-CoA hydratase/isomerase family protein [Ectothiorhodospiraceae bacterium]